MPRDVVHAGVDWARRRSHETAWERQGHSVLAHTLMVEKQSNHSPRPPFFYRSSQVVVQGRVPCDTLVCAHGSEPFNPGAGPSTPKHCDSEPVFGLLNEPKVFGSNSLGQSVLFNLHRRSSASSPSSIRLDHGDLLVMDGLTHMHYDHSTAPGLQRTRVNLTFPWISPHITSCRLAEVIGCALPSCAQGLAVPHPPMFD